MPIVVSHSELLVCVVNIDIILTSNLTAIRTSPEPPPSLFRELKIKIDENRQQYGKWLLTGSQKFQLMQNVGESLAGRIRILHLETLSAQEIRRSNLFSPEEIKAFLLKGGYPELWENKKLNFLIFLVIMFRHI